jgi:hypothetical protein
VASDKAIAVRGKQNEAKAASDKVQKEVGCMSLLVVLYGIAD